MLHGYHNAAYISEKLNLPMNYVRSKSKSHGKQNQIEGAVITKLLNNHLT
jgi:orotate phosphoribosyltransferase